MKEDGKDPYDIKKFAEVLDESKMMVPDSEARLKKNVEELDSFLKENPDLESEEFIITAKNLIAQHSQFEYLFLTPFFIVGSKSDDAQK